MEADLLREYDVDLMDFYRGTLSARRVWVLMRQLSPKSSLVRAMNDGNPVWGQVEHLLADLWALTLRGQSDRKSRAVDHPARAAIVAKARNERKLEKHKRMQKKHGIGVGGDDGGE